MSYEQKEYSQQSGYVPQSAMSVPRNQPEVATTRGQPQGKWKIGLFSCFDDCGLCLKTFCCPCITYVSLYTAAWNYLAFSPLFLFSNTIHYRAKQKKK